MEILTRFAARSMAGREICCCGARSWTKAIAYVQIAVHGIAILIVAITLIAIAIGGRPLYHKAALKMNEVDADYSDDKRPVALLGYIGYLIFLMILLVVFICGVITGIFLLKGVQKSNTNYLRCWTIFAGVCAVLSILSVLVSPSFDDIMSVLFTIGLYGFAIWVVRILIAEINMEELKRQEELCNNRQQPEYNSYYHQHI